MQVLASDFMPFLLVLFIVRARGPSSSGASVRGHGAGRRAAYPVLDAGS